MTSQTRPPEVPRAAPHAVTAGDATGTTSGQPAPASGGDGRALALAVAIATATILVLLVVAGAALAGSWEFNPSPTQTPSMDALPTPESPPPSAPGGEPQGNSIVERIVTSVLLVAAGLLAAFLIHLLVRWIRRSLLPWLAALRTRPAAAEPEEVGALDALPLTELRTAAAHAETLVREGERSPDAIIAAWLALQDAAERSGATRAPAQTPTEFTVEVLAATPASPGAVTELLGLFHQARFARTEMTAAQAAAAGAALRQLIDDFSRPTPSPETEETP